ncbi:hypothetical protein [Pseudomonas sp. NPDC087336]|uniref:hypothetical protein n=1 Tax=Pseudomonas sp. NPDC087336 TaxID=3364436 RepID=UPI00382BB6A2
MNAVTDFLRGEIDFAFNDNPCGSVHSFAAIEDPLASPGLTLRDPRLSSGVWQQVVTGVQCAAF